MACTLSLRPKVSFDFEVLPDDRQRADTHRLSFLPAQDETKKPLVDLPTLREYFIDLEFVLGVCSDGPAKSFAFRRLKYLASKWNLYTLLNEYQELSDMKRVPHR